MSDGDSLVLVPVGVVTSVLGLLGSCRSCPVDLGHTAGPEPAAASLVAHCIRFSEAVDIAVATGLVVVGEAVVVAVASTYRAVLGT
jgi:hypothetical protein